MTKFDVNLTRSSRDQVFDMVIAFGPNETIVWK